MSIANTLSLESNRQIKINFAGGDLSSDAGLLLIKEFEDIFHHAPALSCYYAAFFSIRSDNFSYELMCQGKDALETVMQQLLGKEQLSKKEQDMLKDMRTVQEMYARGFEFLPIDIFKANVSKFTIIDGKIMPALTSITGLGEKAAQSMADAIQSGEISCVADLEVKTLVGQKMLIELDRLGIFHDLPKSNQLSMFDTLF